MYSKELCYSFYQSFQNFYMIVDIIQTIVANYNTLWNYNFKRFEDCVF